jgi:hypothetical protein
MNTIEADVWHGNFAEFPEFKDTRNNCNFLTEIFALCKCCSSLQSTNIQIKPDRSIHVCVYRIKCRKKTKIIRSKDGKLGRNLAFYFCH